MKKLILILLVGIGLNSCSSTYKSYPVEYTPKTANKPVYYYNIPASTEVVFDVTFTKTIKQKGVFANQSNLLGVKDIITSDEVKYEVKDIKISTNTNASNLYQYSLILKNDKVDVLTSCEGTLQSIRVKGKKSGYKTQKTQEFNQEKNESSSYSKPMEELSSIKTKPIFETRLQQRGMLEKVNMTAADAVKKIEQLRDRQIDILSGGLEGTYINTTVDFMYKQLDEMIDGYVSMFTGVETVVEEIYTYTLTPVKPIISEEDLVLQLSSSPIPLLARFKTNNQTKALKERPNAAANPDTSVVVNIKEKEASGINGVYYAIPELVLISVETPKKTFSKSVELNQYGVIKSMITKNKNIEFNPNNGAIKSIK
jgi:hypothetical protein